nr:pyruvate dehydrogenase E1 component subunit beta-1, mitochondrial [Tanacetum cinerariifolium]
VGFAESGVGSSYHGLKPVVESLTLNFSMQSYLHSVRKDLKEELKEEMKVELKEEMRAEIQDMLVQYVEICKAKFENRIKNRIIEFRSVPKGRGEQIKIDLLTGKKRNSIAWTEWDRSIARGGDG